MRVVLDTNIILSSIARYSPYKIIMDKLEEGAYDVCVTTEILLEYEEKLTQNFSDTIANLIIGAFVLKSNVVKTEVYYRWNLITSDADDNKFVDCALAANANFLVTNDKDYNILKRTQFPFIEVITIDEFVSLLNSV